MVDRGTKAPSLFPFLCPFIPKRIEFLMCASTVLLREDTTVNKADNYCPCGIYIPLQEAKRKKKKIQNYRNLVMKAKKKQKRRK